MSKNSELLANLALSDTARTRRLDTLELEDLEATQRMPVADRRYRQTEARGQVLNGGCRR